MTFEKTEVKRSERRTELFLSCRIAGAANAVIRQSPIFSSQFCRLEVCQGMTGSSAQGMTGRKSKRHLGCILVWKLWGRLASRLIGGGCWQDSFLTVVGLTPFPSSALRPLLSMLCSPSIFRLATVSWTCPMLESLTSFFAASRIFYAFKGLIGLSQGHQIICLPVSCALWHNVIMEVKATTSTIPGTGGTIRILPSIGITSAYQRKVMRCCSVRTATL